MLIAKQNQQPIAVILSRAGMEQLDLGVFTSTTIVALKQDMYILRLEDLIRQRPP
jgi:hypothetical protein